jgi:acetolactate synthase regulatory subunit
VRRNGAGPYHLSLIGNHRSGGGNDLRPSRHTDAHAAVQQPSDHVNAVIFERIVGLAQSINHASDPTGQVDRLDIHLHQLPKLLSHRSRRFAQRKGFNGIKIEKDSHKEDGQHHVELVLGVNSARVLLCFQGQREYVGGEVGVRNVADTTDESISEVAVWRR